MLSEAEGSGVDTFSQQNVDPRRVPISRLQELFRIKKGPTVDAAIETSDNSRNDLLREDDGDFKLNVNTSLIIVLFSNVLMQITFFIIVSSSSAYADHLRGSATFSGLVIGIPTAFSGLALIPLMRLDKGQYAMPLHFACGSMVLGSILYGLAYKANFLYLILMGRIVQGFGFSFWMYSKRYCTDSRVVGVRRRTTLAGWLVLGQGVGMSAGPFVGGLLYKVGFKNDVFNGFTAPAWLMAGFWLIFWAICALYFEDVPREDQSHNMELAVRNDRSFLLTTSRSLLHRFQLAPGQLGVVVTMCWFAMTCFFILGAWESNIPVFASVSSPRPSVSSMPTPAWLARFAPQLLSCAYPISPFHWSPFASGNFIALGGISIFPFLFLNLHFARRMQDRHILALGSGLGLLGLLIALGLLRAQPVHGSLTFGGFFVCWFLVALGFNLASTCTLSLLSKQLPPSWNGRTSLAIQYSNYTGRVAGAVWGGSGVKVGMLNYLGLEIAIIGIGALMFMTLWRELKAKTG